MTDYYYFDRQNNKQSINAGVLEDLDKDSPFRYVVMKPTPPFAFGEVMALFLEKEEAKEICERLNQ